MSFSYDLESKRKKMCHREANKVLKVILKIESLINSVFFRMILYNNFFTFRHKVLKLYDQPFQIGSSRMTHTKNGT